MKKILIVEDNPSFRLFLKESLNEFASIKEASNLNEGMKCVEAENFDLIILDNKLPDGSGIDYVSDIIKISTEQKIVILTAYADIPLAIKAIKSGAIDFWTKPIDYDELRKRVKRILESSILETELTAMIVGDSDYIRDLRKTIKHIASTDINVVITGESGTGKDFIAKTIHRLSMRNAMKFTIIDCNAINNTLFESELFGSLKGAYSGADETRKGKLEIADKGTVYFDNIDSLNIQMQGKLIRFIESGEFYSLGASKPKRVDVRIIASACNDLESLCKQGKFRNDLFFRLNVYPVKLLPLRERMNDIHSLIDEIYRLKSSMLNRDFNISRDMYEKMEQYNWPGNIREMGNLIERVIVNQDKMIIDALPIFKDERGLKEKVKVVTKEMEIDEIKSALIKTAGNKSKAAKILKISYRNLLDKIKEYGINE